MKKILTRALFSLPITVGLCVASVSSYAAEERTGYVGGDSVSGIETYIAENGFNDEVRAETEADKAYDELIGSFSLDEEGEYDYPDDYGGSYIDNGNLVILSTTPSIRSFDSANKNYNGVVYKQVKYSYKELSDLCFNMMSGSEYDFYYGYVDDKNNEVVLATNEETCNDQTLAELTADLPIRFEVGGPVVPLADITVYD